MTNSPSVVPLTDSDGVVSGELVDLLLEAVVLPPDAKVRAAVVTRVAQEMCAAVVWLHGTSGTGEDAAVDRELTSLGRVVVAAQEHQQRMRASDSGEDG
jgi:hypothetical protein